MCQVCDHSHTVEDQARGPNMSVCFSIRFEIMDPRSLREWGVGIDQNQHLKCRELIMERARHTCKAQRLVEETHSLQDFEKTQADE